MATAKFDIPLGVGLPEKSVQKIKAGEYIDLYSILFPYKETQTLVVNTTEGGASTVNVQQNQTRQLNSIDMWTSATNIYGSIYVGAKIFQKCLKYFDFNPSRYKSHSFRIGAATTAIARGYTSYQVQEIGR